MIDDDGGMETVRRQGRRLAWLMAGAAIGLAVVLLVLVVVVLVTGPDVVRPGRLGLIAVPSLLLAGLLGLVPGVRELEVTGARSMLGAEGEMLVPRRTRAAHHLRTALWVVLHLLSGLLCAMLLATFVPSAALFLVELAIGRGLGSGLQLPMDGLGRLGAAVLSLLVGTGSLLAWWPLGAGLARLAPRLLGPTAADRLEAAELRVAREAERTRIARELHDGIGHALTVVSVQAAAARTIQHRDPEAAATALAAIEETARGATGELDAVLALLREEEQGRRAPHRTAAPAARSGRDGDAEGTGGARAAGVGKSSAGSAASVHGDDAVAGEEDLETLLARHRRAGMDLRRRGELPADIVPLQRRHLLRGLGELLANAQRHAAPGPVTLDLGADEDRVRLEVTSPVVPEPSPADASADPGTGAVAGAGSGAAAADSEPRAVVTGPDAAPGGRGLIGLRERAALLGGTLEAGRRGDRWIARLDLPLLREEER